MKKAKKTVSKKQKKVSVKAKKNALMIIKSPVDPTKEIVMASELADETLIQNELVGSVLPQYVYSFTDKRGNEQKGLSVFGVRESIRLINRNPKSGSKVRINPQFTKVERDVEQNGQKGIEVWVFAEDLITAASAWGSKFEPYKKRRADGSLYPNAFALEVALSKAERNAMRKLMPEKVVIAMINKLIKEHGQNSVQTFQLADPEEQQKAEKKNETETNFKKAVQMIDACKRRETLLEYLKSVSKSQAYGPEQKKQLVDQISAKLKKLNA